MSEQMKIDRAVMKLERAITLVQMFALCMLMLIAGSLGAVILVKIGCAGMILCFIKIASIDIPYWRTYGKPTIIQADFHSDLQGGGSGDHEGCTSDGQS